MKILFIKQVREKFGMTKKQFADAVGVKRSAIWNYENGIRQPRPNIAKNIIKFVNSRGFKKTLEDIYKK